MIIHLIENEKFLEKTITIFEDLDKGNNFYLIANEKSNNFNINLQNLKGHQYYLGRPNTAEYNSVLNNKIESSELVIFHNLYKNYKLKFLKNFEPGNVKIAWVFWGAELYGLNTKLNNILPRTQELYFSGLPLGQRLKKIISKYIKRNIQWHTFRSKIVKKVDFILTNLNGDVELINKYTHSNFKPYWFTYFSIKEGDLEKPLQKKNRIILGNSSSVTNNHFDAIDLLISLGFNSYDLYMPLNYGDERYKHLIKSYTKNRLGRSAQFIEDFLTYQDYLNLLTSCTSVIMNHVRQQAFNTIMLALYAGCKVFLREENTIYKTLKEEGFIVFTIQNDLNSMQSLLSLSDGQQKHNRAIITENYSYDKLKERIGEQINSILRV